jgi:FixJ family two-component response regulator
LLGETRSSLGMKDATEHFSKPEDEISEIPPVSVIDDDDSVRRAMERLIRSFGFPVVVFPSAREFLLSSHVRDTVCLILDVQMPHMNGLQLQSHLAQAGCRIPIIFITAHRDERARARALQAGAVDLLEKPFRDDALLDGIRRALRLGNTDGLPR